jgi:hypothetical protein
VATRATPTTADRAAHLAALLWGGRPWDRLDPAWRERLRAARRDATTDPGTALAALRDGRRAHARPDLHAVHPSWLVRALQGELPAVRRAVVARLDAPLRADLRAALALPADDLDPPHPPLPEALAVAGALWAERLVGGPAQLPGDPPVIRAIAAHRGPTLTRLAGLCALAKRAYLVDDDDLPRLAPEAAAHREAFATGWGGFRRDAALAALARFDLRGGPGISRGDLARVGLLTLGRLLATADPDRTRWALQLLPYPVARRLRTYLLGRPKGIEPALLLAWEGQVLTLAASRLDPAGPAAEGEPSP